MDAMALPVKRIAPMGRSYKCIVDRRVGHACYRIVRE